MTIARRAITTTLPRNPSTIRDDGVYTFDRLKFGEQWQLLAGVRYSDYENESSNATYTETELSPSVGLVFKPANGWSIYATYLEGLEEGGIAPANTENAFEVLPPAVSEQIELGTKLETSAGLSLTLAAFQIDRPSAFTLDNRFVLDGRSRYRGLEFIAAGELSAQWSVLASGMWLDAEQRTAANVQLIGKRPENTAEYTGSLFVEYRPHAMDGLALNAGAFYVGDRAVNPLNQGTIGGVTTFSAGARYRFDWQGRVLTTQLNIDNLTDKDYWNTAGNGLLGVGAPRTSKLSMTIEF
jgi:iron complex outermembrane receptor protein